MWPDTVTDRPSYLGWMFSQLGYSYAILLPLAGIVCFVLALIIVLRGRGPMAAASLVLIVHVPLLIGVFAAIQGAIQTCTVIHGVAPGPVEWAYGIGTTLLAPMAGMLMMVPGYATAALGALIRGLRANASSMEAASPDRQGNGPAEK